MTISGSPFVLIAMVVKGRRPERKERSYEDGFTLIELLVVVLVIAILIAIAIPTFLGARARALDRQAQSNLRNALTAERGFYAKNERYSADPAEMSAWEPGLDWSQPNAAARGVVPAVPGVVVNPGYDLNGDGNNNCSVNTSNGVTTVSGDCYIDARLLCLWSVSGSGNRFLLVDVASGAEAGTYFHKNVACPSDPTGLAGWSWTGW